MTKICKRCKIEKPINEFHKHSGYPDGHRARCKYCYLNSFLVRSYGITTEIYLAELSKRENKCDICKENCKLFVDHNHVTMKFRGLICMKCNSAIGLMNDSVVNLKNMIEYLEKGNKI